MTHDLELAYLGIEVPDPARPDTVLRRTLSGSSPAKTAGRGVLAWRNDDTAHRVIVRARPANDAVFVGFEAVDAAAFDRVVERLSDAGCAPAESAKAEAAARRRARVGHRRRALGRADRSGPGT